MDCITEVSSWWFPFGFWVPNLCQNLEGSRRCLAYCLFGIQVGSKNNNTLKSNLYYWLHSNVCKKLRFLKKKKEKERNAQLVSIFNNSSPGYCGFHCFKQRESSRLASGIKDRGWGKAQKDWKKKTNKIKQLPFWIVKVNVFSLS